MIVQTFIKSSAIRGRKKKSKPIIDWSQLNTLTILINSHFYFKYYEISQKDLCKKKSKQASQHAKKQPNKTTRSEQRTGLKSDEQPCIVTKCDKVCANPSIIHHYFFISSDQSVSPFSPVALPVGPAVIDVINPQTKQAT